MLGKGSGGTISIGARPGIQSGIAQPRGNRKRCGGGTPGKEGSTLADRTFGCVGTNRGGGSWILGARTQAAGGKFLASRVEAAYRLCGHGRIPVVVAGRQVRGVHRRRQRTEADLDAIAGRRYAAASDPGRCRPSVPPLVARFLIADLL